MRDLVAIIWIVLISLSCDRIESHVHITNVQDTVLVGETYEAQLSVPSVDSISPMFYVIFRNDSIPIPYYEEKGYAVFQIEVASEGGKEYKGFVDYRNKSGDEIRDDFAIEFYVKEK